MAGDWIKMQSNLWTSPKIVRIMSATKADKCRVVGALFRVWCLFDEHTEGGFLEGYTFFLLDDELRIDGFSQAMSDVGWLEEVDGEGLQVPDFSDHMGQSAKKRAQDSKRKKEGRKKSENKAEKKRTREEKRREDIKTYYADLLEAYNCLDKPNMLSFTDNRKKHFAARCLDDYSRDLDWWLNLVRDIPNHKAAMDGDWFNFEWLIKSENNLTKFIEGKYRKGFSSPEQKRDLSQKSDSQLMAMCEELSISTVGKTRWQMIDSLEARS